MAILIDPQHVSPGRTNCLGEIALLGIPGEIALVINWECNPYVPASYTEQWRI